MRAGAYTPASFIIAQIYKNFANLRNHLHMDT